MEEFIGLYIIQLIFWALFGLFALIAAEEAGDDTGLERIYSIASYKIMLGHFKNSTMYTIWIYITATIGYLLLLPLSLWMFLNLLPFKLVYEVLSGRLVTGTLSFIFQDKRKV